MCNGNNLLRYEILLNNEKIINYLKIFKLDDEESNYIKLLYKNKDIRKSLVDFQLSNNELVFREEDWEFISLYINEVINPMWLNITNRLKLINNNLCIGWTIEKHINFIDCIGYYLLENILEHIEDKNEYKLAIKSINKLMTLDKTILSKFEDELSYSKSKKALEFLPNMAFVLSKYEGEEEFKFDYCEGTLAEYFNIYTEITRGKVLSEVIDEGTLDKIQIYIDSAIHSEINEFNVIKNDRTLRTVIKSKKEYDPDLNKMFLEITGNTTDVTELNKSEEKTRQLAYYDSLTNLANRELFNKKLNEMFEYSGDDKSFGLMFIDIDDFKSVNDQLGHYAGDQLLIEIAKRLKTSIRSIDMVSRLAGDEFTILCTKVKSNKDLEFIVERVIDSIANKPFYINKQERHITLSVGVAVYPGDGEDAETLLGNADLAMYKAKNSGKNSYRFFEPSMSNEVITKLQVQNDLRKAMDRNEFYLQYQLQYDANIEKIVGVEALIRWNHPDKGYIPPSEFIEVAEDTGLIVDMGYWVIEEGCRKLRTLIDKGHKDLVLSINFSALQFLQRDLVDVVSRILRLTGLPAKNLMIEITESTSMDDVEITINILKSLRELGILISIDDFGTGYSSLSYLKKFPITNLKIDKSFVHELTKDRGTHQLVNSIIALAKSLELDVVAEGVETKEQFEILKDLGCNKFQGYYFGKPVTFPLLEAKLENREDY